MVCRHAERAARCEKTPPRWGDLIRGLLLAILRRLINNCLTAIEISVGDIASRRLAPQLTPMRRRHIRYRAEARRLLGHIVEWRHAVVRTQSSWHEPEAEIIPVAVSRTYDVQRNSYPRDSFPGWITTYQAAKNRRNHSNGLSAQG